MKGGPAWLPGMLPDGGAQLKSFQEPGAQLAGRVLPCDLRHHSSLAILTIRAIISLCFPANWERSR